MVASLNFEEMDWENEVIDELSQNIAELVLKQKLYLRNYIIPLLRQTGMGHNYKEVGYIFCDKLKRSLFGEAKKIDDYMRQALKLPEEQWGKFRGTLAEKIIEPKFRENHQGNDIYFGAATIINGEKVNIRLESGEGRQTVDAIAWCAEDYSGVFMEIKFKPEGFKEATIVYLRELDSKLTEVEVNHEIQLLAFDDVVAINSLFKEQGINLEDTHYTIKSAIEYINS